MHAWPSFHQTHINPLTLWHTSLIMPTKLTHTQIWKTREKLNKLKCWFSFLFFFWKKNKIFSLLVCLCVCALKNWNESRLSHQAAWKRIKRQQPPLKNLNLKTSHDKIIIITMNREKLKRKNEKFAFHLITFVAFVYLLYDICRYLSNVWKWNFCVFSSLFILE